MYVLCLQMLRHFFLPFAVKLVSVSEPASPKCKDSDAAAAFSATRAMLT